jgi:hypothetical protein
MLAAEESGDCPDACRGDQGEWRRPTAEVCHSTDWLLWESQPGGVVGVVAPIPVLGVGGVWRLGQSGRSRRPGGQGQQRAAAVIATSTEAEEPGKCLFQCDVS